MESVCNSQGHKHINGNAHRSYQVLLFFYIYWTTTPSATADHCEKQHSSTRNLYAPGVNTVHWTVFRSSASSIS